MRLPVSRLAVRTGVSGYGVRRAGLVTFRPMAAEVGGLDKSSRVSERATAWAYQDEFLKAGTKLVERVFGQLGVEPLPILGLVGLASWKEEEHPPVVERPPGM